MMDRAACSRLWFINVDRSSFVNKCVLLKDRTMIQQLPTRCAFQADPNADVHAMPVSFALLVGLAT